MQSSVRDNDKNWKRNSITFEQLIGARVELKKRMNENPDRESYSQ